MPLQCASERSAASTVRSGACVHKLPCGASRNVTIDLILDAGAISQLTIDGEAGHPVRFRDSRAVIRESSRPEPFFTDPELLPDRDLARVREMQIGGYRPFFGSRDSGWGTAQRSPSFPFHRAPPAPAFGAVLKSA